MNIQPAQAIDRNRLNHLGILCYDYPIAMEAWEQILNSKQGDFSVFSALKYVLNGDIIGYAVYGEVPIEEDGYRDLHVLQLGVRPDFRRRGYGTQLCLYLRKICEKNKFSQLQITVPEYVFDADENDEPERSYQPRNIQDFMISAGLQHHKVEHEVYYHYGRIYDGVVLRSGAQPVSA